MRHTLTALRVLVVLPFPPLPEGGAASRCALGLLRGLQARGTSFHALAADMGSASAEAPPSDLPVEVMGVEWPSRVRARTERVLSPNSLLSRGPFAERVKQMAADADVVHLVDSRTAGMIGQIDRPAVVQLDCVTLRDRKLEAPWHEEGRITIELLRSERRACKSARWLLASSPEVRRPLAASWPHAHVAVAPLALDLANYRQAASLQSSAAGLIGNANWPPTRQAVERLLSGVWPLVSEQRPEARLLLAGTDMERATFAHLPDSAGIEWHGRVPAAADFLRELGFLLYPLTSGSGAKVKVLEALALGLPVVSTPDGTEGLGALGGVDVETADRLLAAAAVRLHDDMQARRRAGKEARQTFAEHHTPMAAAGPVLDLYERMRTASA